MEYRKMVLMNLFAGQERRGRHREQTCGHCGRKGSVERVERVTLTYIHYHV